MQDDKISISLVTNEYNKHFLSHGSFFTKGNDKKLTEERETLTRGHTSAMWCLFNYANIASSICRTKSSVMIRCSCAKRKPRMKVSSILDNVYGKRTIPFVHYIEVLVRLKQVSFRTYMNAKALVLVYVLAINRHYYLKTSGPKWNKYIDIWP